MTLHLTLSGCGASRRGIPNDQFLKERNRERRKEEKKACVSSLLFTGFVHADPHAGNLILTEDGRLAFLDFGLMGTVEPHIMEGFSAPQENS